MGGLACIQQPETQVTLPMPGRSVVRGSRLLDRTATAAGRQSGRREPAAAGHAEPAAGVDDGPLLSVAVRARHPGLLGPIPRDGVREPCQAAAGKSPPFRPREVIRNRSVTFAPCAVTVGNGAAGAVPLGACGPPARRTAILRPATPV
jgi:hypothetical protein